MDIVIIVIVTIFGWGITHYLYIQAQKKAALNSIKNDARIQIITSLKEYLDWLDDVTMFKMNVEWCFESGTDIEKLNNHINNLYNSVKKIKGKILPVDLLEQYSIIFPQTIDVKKYLWKMHVEMHTHLNSRVNQIKNFNVSSEEDILAINSIDGYKIGAQKWIVKDLIICLQNIILADITGTKLTKFPQDDIGNFEIKHPRVKYDSNGNIYVTKERYSKEVLKELGEKNS
ncbi:MAG: hypothetical protein KDC42_08430 [Ignavibacteriae bacterium]|nr:hypothetical protein [Ignavibacteriota bacterium]